MRNLKGISCLLVGLILAILLWSYLFTPSAQAQIKLKYAIFPPPTTYPGVAMELWKKEIEKRTNAKVKVETYPGGSLLTAKSMLDGIVKGIADIGEVHLGYHPGAFPVMEVVLQPLGWPNAAVSTACAWGIYKKYAPKELEDFKVISIYTNSPTNIMSRKPIHSLSDIKGYELRTTGAGSKIVELFGGVPIAMPMSEVPEALQRDVVKGLVTSVEVLKDFRFAEYTRYVTGNLNIAVGVSAVIMNQKKWDSLPEDIKNIIDAFANEHGMSIGRYNDDHSREALEWSKKNYNIQIHNFPKDELTKWFTLLKPMVDAYLESTEKRGLPGRALLQEVSQLKGKYTKEYAK